MSIKHKLIMFVGMIISCGSIYTEGLGVGICQILSPIIPFYMLPMTIVDVSWKLLVISGIIVLLESFIVHRMLQKAYVFVVMRMLIVNLIESLVLILMLFSYGLLYNIAERKLMSKGFFPFYVSVFCLFIAAILFFKVRWIVDCKIYAYFDSSVDRDKLNKAMLYAKGLSYVVLVILFKMLLCEL